MIISQKLESDAKTPLKFLQELTRIRKLRLHLGHLGIRLISLYNLKLKTLYPPNNFSLHGGIDQNLADTYFRIICKVLILKPQSINICILYYKIIKFAEIEKEFSGHLTGHLKKLYCEEYIIGYFLNFIVFVQAIICYTDRENRTQYTQSEYAPNVHLYVSITTFNPFLTIEIVLRGKHVINNYQKESSFKMQKNVLLCNGALIHTLH